MPDELVIRHCAPTLAALKTGSLFTCTYSSMPALRDDLRSLNQRLRDKGLCAVPLRCREGRCLVYLYRPALLHRDLTNAHAAAILQRCGYPCPESGHCVRTLWQRVRAGGAFPHEIGLFLGYPPEDVEGFMNHQEAKLAGMWKVYGDVDAAQRTFARYRHCTEACLAQYAKGRALQWLAVAAPPVGSERKEEER